MNRFVLGLLCIFALLSSPLPALAGSVKLKEYGVTHAPPGFVDFCTRYEDQCSVRASKSGRISLTTEQWETLYQTNYKLNGRFTSADDKKLHGKAEYWTLPQTAADCEDYVLAKQYVLEKQGFPRSALRITVVLDENGGGHAVLTVVTDKGDLILDNRRDDIRLPKETGYEFRKRQSASDPKKWVSLTPQAPTSLPTSSN